MIEQKLTFQTSWKNDDHNWGKTGEKITSKENLLKLKNILENVGSIIVEHWIYCGSQAPERLIFDEYDEFVDYLKKNAHAGDIIDVWSMHELLCVKNRLVTGKCPDDNACVPEGGTY